MTADTSRNVERAETPEERIARLERTFAYYVEEARKAIDEGRWDDLHAAIRARGDAEVALIRAQAGIA